MRSRAKSREPRAESGRPRVVRGAAAGLLALVLASGTLTSRAAAQEEPIGLARGAAVRPVQIADLDGQTVDLGQVIGRKPVLVEFWATWCSNCAALEPRMRAAFQRHGSQVEFVVVAVGVNQSRASVKRHVAQHPLPANRVLWDGTGAAVRAFATPATSYVVLLDRQGKVVYTGIGPDQNLEAALAGVGR